METLRVSNEVKDCEEYEDFCGDCNGQGCITIVADVEDSDESVDDEDIEDEAEEH